MERHIEREKAMISVYQQLLTSRDLTEIVEDTFELPISSVSEFAKILTFNSIEQKERYIGYINQVLNEWTFDRLGYIEQALLLIGCSEFDKKTADAAVIIDEAILLAKEYCDEDSYKLINGVLDTL